MDIKDRIKELRGEMRQEDFAARLGLKKNTIGRFERGEQKPGFDDLQTILSEFPDISPSWLLSGEGPMTRSAVGGSELSVDKQVLWEVIVRVERIFARLSKPWPPEKKAELIVLLHDEIMEGELKSEDVEKNVLRIVKLAS
jgi:transcriptional regulator with XRE-family HTH domain